MNSVSKITEIVSKLKSNWTELLDTDWIDRQCVELGHSWRDRILTPGITIRLFLLQILHSNTSCSNLRHLSELSFSAASYCNARKRLPLEVFEQLVEQTAKRIGSEIPQEGLWKGHRVWLGDGSGCSMPDTKELREYFGQPGCQKKGCGFPVAHLLALMNCQTGMLHKMIASPLHTHDLSKVSEFSSELRKEDILVLDRGFCSSPLILALTAQEIHSVIRVTSRHKVDFRRAKYDADTGIRRRRIAKLGSYEQIVEWHKPQNCPPWMNEQEFKSLPDFVLLREIRYRLDSKGYRSKEVTLVTTLLDPKKYSRMALIKLYGMRWDIETNFRHLKISMEMDVLKAKTVEGVKKEICIFTLAYNLVRQAMLEQAKCYRVPLKQISFLDTLRWLFAENNKSKPLINPCRPGRKVPRVTKRRPKAYPRMTSKRKNSRGITPDIMEIQQLVA